MTPYRGSYAALKAGAIVPRHDDLRGFDTGFSLEAALGYQVSANIALEGGIGYFKIAGSASAVIYGVPVNATGDLSAVSVTASLKAIAHAGGFELFALAGPGMYILPARATASSPGFRPVSRSDSGHALGFHFGGGASVGLGPETRLGTEVRYIIATARIFDANTGMDSFIAQATLGFRF